MAYFSPTASFVENEDALGSPVAGVAESLTRALATEIHELVEQGKEGVVLGATDVVEFLDLIRIHRRSADSCGLEYVESAAQRIDVVPVKLIRRNIAEHVERVLGEDAERSDTGFDEGADGKGLARAGSAFEENFDAGERAARGHVSPFSVR